MKNLLVLFGFLFTMNSAITGQSFGDKLSTGFNFEIKAPEGLLRENGLTNYYGLSTEVFYVGCTDKKIRFSPGYRLSGGITKRIAGEQFSLTTPAGAQVTEKLFNAFLSIELAGRFIYDNGNRFRPYLELYAGPRFTSGHEVLELTEPIPGYEDGSEMIFSGGSMMAGVGIGALIQVSDKVDLNFKFGTEYTGKVSHSDLSNQARYSRQAIQTTNTFNHTFSIGFNYRPACGRVSRRNRRHRPNTCAPAYRYYQPQPVKVTRT